MASFAHPPAPSFWPLLLSLDAGADEGQCVDSGTLFNLLEQTEAKLPEPAVRFFAAQIFLALDMLHRQGFVYRDLKLENILIDEKGKRPPGASAQASQWV